MFDNFRSTEIWVGIIWDSSVQKFWWTDNNAEVIENLPWYNLTEEPNCMTLYQDICNYGGPDQNCVRRTQSGYFKTIYCDSTYLPLCQGLFSCKIKQKN